MAIVGRFSKTPAEQYPKEIDFTAELPSGSAITTRTGSATNLTTQADATSAVLVSASGSGSGGIMRLRVKAGAAGTSYLITFTVALDSGPGDVLVDHLLMKVETPTP